jgi:hypothetical protein
MRALFGWRRYAIPSWQDEQDVRAGRLVGTMWGECTPSPYTPRPSSAPAILLLQPRAQLRWNCAACMVALRAWRPCVPSLSCRSTSPPHPACPHSPPHPPPPPPCGAATGVMTPEEAARVKPQAHRHPHHRGDDAHDGGDEDESDGEGVEGQGEGVAGNRGGLRVQPFGKGAGTREVM